MKKALILTGVLALALGFTWLVLHKNGSGSGRAEDRDAPLEINSKSSAFNRSIASVLNSYYVLCDGFTEPDTSLISSASRKLNEAVDSIRFDQLKADTSIIQTAISLALSIKGEISGLKGEHEMEQKKREFNMITDQLYSLVRTISYDGSTIYHMRCPVAFSDSSEAYWLSPTNKIVNPYLGRNNSGSKNKTLDFGEISDSIHFSAPASE